MSQILLIDDSQSFTQISNGIGVNEPTQADMTNLGQYSGQTFAKNGNEDKGSTALDTLTTIRQDTSGMSINQGAVSLMTYHHYF